MEDKEVISLLLNQIKRGNAAFIDAFSHAGIGRRTWFFREVVGILIIY